ncbi:MAG: hypothetical protein HY707_00570 [Ignavibacteriae bacterium]|nr:hypothetical protein [Ignavibacteriota bacterium]
MNRVDDSKPSSVHYILGIHPSGRMFATDQQQIYWSDNRGKSWKKVEQNFYPSGFFGFSFDSEGRIFTAGSLYESTDLGMSWKSIDRGVEHLRNRFISVTDSDVLFAGGYIIDTLRSAACVYRSADHGVTWNPTTLGGGTVTSITAQPRAIVFVSIWGNGLWRSSDNGLSWEKIYYGPRQGDLRFGTIFSDASGVLYSGVSYTEGGDPYVPRSTFVESTNGGRTWTTKIEGVKYGWVQTLTQDPKGYLYILDMEGNIYRGKIGLKPQ